MPQIETRSKVIPFGNDKEIEQCLVDDGVVTVSNVFERNQIEEYLDEVWTSPRLLGAFDRDNPDSWADVGWPQQNGGRNFLRSSNLFLDVAPWDIQSSPRMLHVQQLLYKNTNLMMSGLGRWGVMRPSGLNSIWRTEGSWLHWDQNPWEEPVFSRIQAIVCLTESTSESGGFACVPGFHKKFEEWGTSNPKGTVVVDGKTIDHTYGNGQPFPLPPDDPCQEEVVQILAPAGSMILWDSRLPHQNVPNISDSAFRVVFYCSMIVQDEESIQMRRQLLGQKRILMDLFEEDGLRFPHKLSPIGRQVHCLPEADISLDDALEDFGIQDRNQFKMAAQLALEAGKAEEDGDINTAIEKHAKAIRVFRDIEAWYGALFI